MPAEIHILIAAFLAVVLLVWYVVGLFYREDDAADSPGARASVGPSDEGDDAPEAPRLNLRVRPEGSGASAVSNPPPAPLRLDRAPAEAEVRDEKKESAHPLYLNVLPAVKVLSTGYAYHGVRVMCKGSVPWRQAKGHRLVFDVIDLCHAVESAVHCHMAGYSDPANGFARHVSPDEPPSGDVLHEWTEVAFLPTSLFIGPKSGMRSLVVRCRIMPSGGDPARAVQVSATVFKANLELPGYRDDPLDEVIIVFSRIVELAMACSVADGVSDDREKSVIREWVEVWSRQMDEDGQECGSRFRSKLLGVLDSEIRKSFTLESAAFALNEYASGQRMEALALCVRVVSVDGVLHEKEMRMIERLSDLLGVDRSVMRSLFDKQFARSGIVVSPDNLEAIVGVDPSWDKDRIRRHLAEQFMRWNSRAPSAKTVEEQGRIRAMLDAIAKLKHKYL